MRRVNRWLVASVLVFLAGPLLAADQPGLIRVSNPTPAPAFALKDLDGKTHRLADLQGKVVLVNFWATWCPPCRQEMPSLERLRQRMAGKDFVILAVNVGESEDTAFAFTGQLEPAPTFPILLDRDSKVLRAWPVKGLPTTFMLDRQGRLVFRAVGGREFDAPQIVADVERLLRSP